VLGNVFKHVICRYYMKIEMLVLILGILLVSSFGLVVAEEVYCEDTQISDCVCRDGVRRIIEIIEPEFSLNYTCVDESEIVCTSDNDCYDYEFCELDNCSAETGKCYYIGSSPGCTAVAQDAVCGCDGETYYSDCARRIARVSKDYDGECIEESSCDSDNLDLCLDEINCSGAGGFWYGGICNEEEEEDDGDNGTQVTKTKMKGLKRASFVPWQKRNESECLEGCKCVGAVVSCPTETGKTITIEAGRSGNVITIDRVQVNTELELEIEDGEDDNGRNRTKLKVKLSNGQNFEIKVMPDVASEKALARLRLKKCSEENNCTIELKEVGQGAGYELQAERHFRILGMFKARGQVKAQVNAETGEIIQVKKPWWTFLATEPEE